ncbi:YpsA SLOG family protein [Larkinella terrae]|uniref:Molybdenum cofactor carrier n=1 Tax=Larkinella terrae TaxID=2025311 RepID=A0A7K0EJA7_9BACT|nr:putative molybdenum carrier protein [Larkinella terrae]MRS61822.1 hypothetical protein [Larkinella terrae]
MAVIKIISGGQTGIDQLALKVARELGIETGGVTPKGFLTEDGPAPWLADYGLIDDSSPNYPPRTRRNVVDSDATVWFGSTDSSGFKLTKNCCVSAKKPFVANPNAIELENWIKNFQVNVLNVAGNRASKLSSVGKYQAQNALTLALIN